MNKESNDAIVIDSSPEEIEKLKKKWEKINKTSSTVGQLASSGFVVSLLSPLDFEGPVVEIVTAVVAAVAFVVKKVSESKLEKLGESESEVISNDDREALLTVTSNLGQAMSKSR